MESQPQPEKKLTPNEQWDQLAVSQILKVLAPNGFKKVLGGQVEVANRQFLNKADVQKSQLMAANMVRLFQELLREYLIEATINQIIEALDNIKPAQPVKSPIMSVNGKHYKSTAK